MGYEVPGRCLSFPAGADLSAKKYQWVKLSSGAVVHATAGTDTGVVGILQNDPESGQMATVMTDGVSKMVCDGSVTEGANVTPDATGGSVAAAGDIVQGRALQAGDDADVIAVLLTLNGGVVPA